jgi:predicted GIY-YIG superfamily endonuclease
MDIQDAILLENQIKGWSKAKKLAFIRGDIPALINLSMAYRDKGK